MSSHSDAANPASCCRRITNNGHQQLIFDIHGGKTSAGPRITLQDSPPSVVVEDGNGNSVTLNAAGITINAAAKVTVNASVVEVSASEVNVYSPIVNFSGVIQADTVIAQQVLKSSGNIW